MIICDGVEINSKLLLFDILLNKFITESTSISPDDLLIMSIILDNKEIRDIIINAINYDAELKGNLKTFVDYYLIQTIDINPDIVRFYGDRRILNGGV